METLGSLIDYLQIPRKVFITTHVKPDGDALGSMLALYHYLLKKGHEAFPVSPTDFGLYLHWMPGSDGVLNFQADSAKALKRLEECDLVICVDFNSLHRIEKLGEHIEASSVPKFMIDHHLDPENFDQWRLWNPDACASAELVYEFIAMMSDEDLVDKNIGTCIYTGIMTDSGSFRYSSVTARVHEIIAKLLSAGVDHVSIHSSIYDTFTERRLQFFGHCICEKLVVMHEYKSAYISVTRGELKEYDINTGDTEGLVNYPMSIADVNFAGLIIEREGIIKLSLRSKGNFPANEFAAKYFNGGGHFNAAGGTFKGTLEEAVETFKKGLEEYKTLLNAV
jgi:phosphoesterase RecJ-like protein